MVTVNDIILRVRDTLSDPDGTRWSDDRLIRLIDEGQKTIAIAAKCLTATLKSAVYSNQSTYTFPDNYIMLSRALYNDSKLDLVSSNQLDEELGVNWETLTGEPKYAVTDVTNRGIIKLAPIPVDVPDPTDLVNADYLTVYYTKMSSTLTTLYDILELDETYKTMLIKYVCGYALRDDMDTQNREFGNEELGIFNDWLRTITVEISKDLVNGNLYLTEYRSGI